MKINQEKFELLRMLNKKTSASQRELAGNLDISVGKLNYILNELKKKGLVKIMLSIQVFTFANHLC